jgi:hypothetical protein
MFTGQLAAQKEDDGGDTTKEGATVTGIRQLDDWVHTINQYLIREMKSRVKKRWHLRRFNWEELRTGVLIDTDMNTIKKDVYDRNGRSLVYYYHSVAEG